MRKRWIWTYIITALAGTGLHFLYDLWPSPIVGLFAPVNESVWEHLKLFFWPFLAAGFFLTKKTSDKQAAWSGVLAGQFVMPGLTLGVYYVLLGGFGLSSTAIDIGLYYLSLAAGFFAAYRLGRSGRLSRLAGVLVILAGLYGGALILFTLAPPELPIFLENL